MLDTSLFVFSIIFFLIATLFDLTAKKIPNQYIVLGIASATCLLIKENGFLSVGKSIIQFLLPIFALYILFYARVLGAGDIKLIAVISAIAPVRWTITFLVMTLTFSALYAITLMTYRGKLVERLLILGTYLRGCFIEGALLEYPGDEAVKGRIRLTPFMLMSACCTQYIMFNWR